MKRTSSSEWKAAFTLAELLVAIAITFILAALLLSVMSKVRFRTKQAVCLSQLKQIGVGLTIFKHDHNELLPASVPVGEGGVKEYVFDNSDKPLLTENQYRVFRVLSNTLEAPKLLLCPTSCWKPAERFETVEWSNHNYWVLVNRRAELNNPETSWCGDAYPDLASRSEWWAYTTERRDDFHGGDSGAHGLKRGNLAYVDGRAEQIYDWHFVKPK